MASQWPLSAVFAHFDRAIFWLADDTYFHTEAAVTAMPLACHSLRICHDMPGRRRGRCRACFIAYALILCYSHALYFRWFRDDWLPRVVLLSRRWYYRRPMMIIDVIFERHHASTVSGRLSARSHICTLLGWHATFIIDHSDDISGEYSNFSIVHYHI